MRTSANASHGMPDCQTAKPWQWMRGGVVSIKTRLPMRAGVAPIASGSHGMSDRLKMKLWQWMGEAWSLCLPEMIWNPSPQVLQMKDPSEFTQTLCVSLPSHPDHQLLGGSTRVRSEVMFFLHRPEQWRPMRILVQWLRIRPLRPRKGSSKGNQEEKAQGWLEGRFLPHKPECAERGYEGGDTKG